MHRLDDKLITQKKQMRISLNYGYVEEKKRKEKVHLVTTVSTNNHIC